MSNWTDQELLQELTRRRDALKGIEPFRQFIQPSGHSDYSFPHMDLHRVMAKAMEDVIFGRKKKVMIMCPPGSAKSTIARQATMLYWALNGPSQRSDGPTSRDHRSIGITGVYLLMPPRRLKWSRAWGLRRKDAQRQTHACTGFGGGDSFLNEPFWGLNGTFKT